MAQVLSVRGIDTAAQSMKEFFEDYPGGGLRTRLGVHLTFLGMKDGFTAPMRDSQGTEFRERVADAYYRIDNQHILVVTRHFTRWSGIQNRAILVKNEPTVFERQIADDVRDLAALQEI